MITFKKYTEIVNAIAKKLKISKDNAVNALVKAQEKGINPLKWQQNLALLTTFASIVAGDLCPKCKGKGCDHCDGKGYHSLGERLMTNKQKLVQIQHYWDALWHLAKDEVKKKSMFTRFGIKNIKLGKNGKIISFEEDIDYEKRSEEEKR